MGQSSSSSTPQGHTKTVTNEQLLNLFNRTCLKQFQPIELVSIQSKLNLNDKDKNELISELEFQNIIDLPDDHTHLLKLLYNFIKTLSQFPLLNHPLTDINYHALLRVIALLNYERCSKILSREFDYVKLVFICLAIESSTTSKEKVDVKPDTHLLNFRNELNVSWLDSQIIQDFDGSQLDQLFIPAVDLLEILTFLLVISRMEPPESLKIYGDNFKGYEKYKVYAFSILKSMNLEITKSNIHDHQINFTQFSSTIVTAAPNLLAPFSALLETLLYDHIPLSEKDETPIIKPIHTSSKLINEYTLSQLSTFLPKELIYSNIRKLYVGSDSGFSMRSFESKAFKWNAPTILLLRGNRIRNDSTNIRYKNFKDDFPLFKGETSEFQRDDDVLIYGVYVDQPWRITNKEFFGGDKTMIFQISPIQKIFKATLASKNVAYFNTTGGGIGIGSQQPLIKNNFKRYQPGNVSLTVDSTLEFGVFRHLGIGGAFRSVDSNDLAIEYEDRFLIKDVEVWGCGGEKELEEQNKRWEWEQREAKRRQTVNLKSIGEDRAILEMAGLVGQNQSGGSV